MTLHQRIAEHLGWSLADVQGFSLLTLQAIVQDPEIKQDITRVIAQGSHIIGRPLVGS